MRIGILWTILALIIIPSCGQKQETVKKETAVTATPEVKKLVVEPSELVSTAFHTIADYFTLKEYDGSKRLYSDKDLLPPLELTNHLSILSESNVTWPGLLYHEISARHNFPISDPLYRKIFNFTMWYDQKAVKRNTFSLALLGEAELRNREMLENKLVQHQTIDNYTGGVR